MKRRKDERQKRTLKLEDQAEADSCRRQTNYRWSCKIRGCSRIYTVPRSFPDLQTASFAQKASRHAKRSFHSSPVNLRCKIRSYLRPKFSGNFRDFCQLERARSRLYRSRFLQPNTHFAAFFEIYKIIIPSHRS